MCFQMHLLHLKPSRIPLSPDLLKKVQMQIILGQRGQNKMQTSFYQRGRDKKQIIFYTRGLSFKTKFAEAYLGRVEKRDWQGKARHPGNSDRNSAAN